MADIRFAVIKGTLNAVTGTQDFTSAGFGTPKAAIIIASHASGVTPIGYLSFSVGFTDGTNQAAAGFLCANNTSSNDYFSQYSNRVIALEGASVIIAATFSAWITDGVRISIDTENVTDNKHVTVILVGGDDVTAKVGSVSLSTDDVTNTISGLGLTPNAVFMISSCNATDNSAGTNGIFSFGCAIDDATDTNRCLAVDYRAATTMALGANLLTDACASQTLATGVTWKAAAGNWQSGSFDLVASTTSNGGDYIKYLALELSGASLYLGTYDVPTTAGFQATTALGFMPDFIMLAQSNLTSVDTVETGSGTENFGIGASSGETTKVHVVNSEDNRANSRVFTSADTQNLIHINSMASAALETQARGYLSSFDTNGFTINYSSVPASALKTWLFGVKSDTPYSPSAPTGIVKPFTEIAGAWSWHSRPNAVRYNGTTDKTYWTQVSTDGYLYACSYDHDTNVYQFNALSNPGADDHNNGSILVLSSGKILFAWCGHPSAAIYYRVTKAVENILEFETLQSVSTKSNYTYAQLVELSDESKILLFTRRDWESGDGGDGSGVDTNDSVWDILISDNSTISFSHHTVPLWFEADGTVQRPYTDMYGNGVDTIWFARSDALSGTDRQDILFAKYISDGANPGSFYEADGTLISTWANLPIMDKTALEMVYDSSAQSPVPFTSAKDIIVDETSGDIAIAFGDLNTSTEVNTFRYARWNGSSWAVTDITTAGYDFTEDAAQDAYEGGISIDPSNIDRVVIGRETSTGSAEWEIEFWTTANEGSTWSKATDITVADTSLPDKIVRPIMPRGYVSGMPVLFFGGTYTTYDNFDTYSYLYFPAAATDTKKKYRRAVVRR